MEIFLVRHTPPKVNAGICYGQTDLSVDINFYSEAEKIKKKIPGKLDVIFSSPLLRCKVLADYLSKAFEIPIIEFDERLKELNFGTWEMKIWETIDPHEFKEWESDLLNYTIPNGESIAALNKRVNLFIDDLLIRNLQKVLITTHAGVIRCFISRLEKIPLLDTLSIPVEYSTVRCVKFN